MNKLCSVLLVTTSFQVYACSIPHHGKEYNSLINIEKTHEKNRYKFTVPRKVGHLKNGVDITLVYYKINSNPKIPKFPGFRAPLDFEFNEMNYYGDFKIAEKKGYNVYINVFWHPKGSGLCGATGISKAIKFNDK